MSNELKDVINKHFDYLKLRERLSQISGIPCMAYTTYQHIDAIANYIADQDKTIAELLEKLNTVRDAVTPTTDGNN